MSENSIESDSIDNQPLPVYAAILQLAVGIRMAQLPRFALPRQPQYVIQRGNNREAIFGAVAQKHHCEIHASVLMTNHVHLLSSLYTEDGIGKVMKVLRRYYTNLNRVLPY